MKKLLIGVLATIGISSAYADSGTVHKYLVENNGWQTEPASLVYLNSRCGALNAAITTRFDGLNDESSVALRKQYLNTTTYFFNASELFGNLAGVSSEALSNRSIYWAEQYATMMNDNWIKYNDTTSGQVGHDLMSCNKMVLPEVSRTVNYLVKASKKKASL